MEEVKEGLVDIQVLSKELMKSVLGPYVQFDRERQEFVFTEEWNKLNNNLKILTYLIGRKGMLAARHLSDEEAVAPKTITEQTYMPSGEMALLASQMQSRYNLLFRLRFFVVGFTCFISWLRY
ncbi:unnamed protein product [marine sediment metagenome]|uniref:Uncharacterized protein n=1 Tax=marine sediment metagenome TaxID=412755 RepID=X1L8L5_9ZZZZ